jgi:predicted RNA methylase
MARSKVMTITKSALVALLAGVSAEPDLRNPPSRLWVAIPVAWYAEIRDAVPHAKPCFNFRLDVTPELQSLVADIYLIYGNAPHTVAQEYYLEVLENGAVLMKYQSILGSRRIGDITPDDLQALKASLIESARRLPGAAVAARASEADEIKLLTAAPGVVRLPTQQLAHYASIKAKLEAAGGRYQRPDGFVFEAGRDTSEVLRRLQAGDVCRIQQETQFFETPIEIAREVCRAAGPFTGRRVLEPSAGRGQLADIARDAGAAEVVVVETWDVNARVLREKGYAVIERDFLSLTPADLGLFDVIVANPPFTRDADADHVMHILQFLAPGGVLSVVTSPRWRSAERGRAQKLRALVESTGATVRVLPAGSFKAAGTSIETTHVVYVNQPDLALVA